MPIRLDHGTLTFVLDEALDAVAVRRIAEAACAFGAPDVVVDLRRARAIDDAALVDLVIALDGASARFELLGLEEHQRGIVCCLSFPRAEPVWA